MPTDINWSTVIASLIAAAGAVIVGVLTTKWNRTSQREANQLTGSGQVFNQQSTFLQDVQEEKDKAKAELKEEREANKKGIAELRTEFEQFKMSVEETFSGYRAYIHGLRLQVHELGGVPIAWPKNLKQ
ncbi:hypothetical protein [uncultured Arthrobacter sp.]|uniref:hypothetical protein n=1 Tax=uncultured Arthrobacter sp. TaxID=114050 RepID=UPI003216F030